MDTAFYTHNWNETYIYTSLCIPIPRYIYPIGIPIPMYMSWWTQKKTLHCHSALNCCVSYSCCQAIPLNLCPGDWLHLSPDPCSIFSNCKVWEYQGQLVITTNGCVLRPPILNFPMIPSLEWCSESSNDIISWRVINTPQKGPGTRYPYRLTVKLLPSRNYCYEWL